MQEENKQAKKTRGKKHVIQYQQNPSSQLLFEDALFGLLCREKGQNFKALKTKYAPKNKHSAFGDFPKDYLPQKPPRIEIQTNNNANTKTQNIRVSQSIPNSKLKSYYLENIRDHFTKSFLLPKNKIDENACNPPKSGAFNPRPIPESVFRLRYDRGDLPVMVDHKGCSSIRWKEDVDFENFDYNIFLPVFFDGLREKMDPYRFLAIQGTFFLLDKVKDLIVKVIPGLIIPLKKALNTRDPDIIIVALKVFKNIYFRSFKN
jgi:hypothetical protein